MSLPYQPFYWGDYHRDTVGLKAEEHGAYLLLIGALWNGGGSLPADDAVLARIACCTPRRWSKVWPVISVFFEVRSTTQGTWLEHRRVTADLDQADAKRERRSNAGKRGAAGKWKKNKGGSMAMPYQSHGKSYPDTNITPFPLSPRAGRLAVARSPDRRALEEFATRGSGDEADAGDDVDR